MSYVKMLEEADTTTALEPAAQPLAALGIGALSKATLIPVETLRTWERRYGFPLAARDAAGQRTYDLETVRRLLLVRAALERGLRAARLLPLPVSELERLLATAAERPETRTGAAGTPDDPPVAGVAAETVAHWLSLAAQLDAATLTRALSQTCERMGLVPFLDDAVGPFLTQVGEAWADGTLSVAHEHFAAEQVRALLSGLSKPSAQGSPAVLCATLPGELHSLGLQMAAATMQTSGWGVIYLGADMPLGDLSRAIKFATRSGNLRGVAISISAAVEPVHARNQLSQLRNLVSSELPIVAGGAGAPSGLAGVDTVTSLRALRAWAAGLG